jgi:hypothetical protein
MSTTKIGLLAVMAAASVVPALASASNWKDRGLAWSENIPASGNAWFTGSLGGVSCSTVTGNIRLEAGSTAKITEFSPTLASCKGTGGLAGCTVTSITVKNLPWAIHDEETFVTVGGSASNKVEIVYTLTGFFCPEKLTIFEEGTKMPKLTPDSTTAIHSLTIGGELEATPGGAGTFSGELKPTNASDSGRYGL